MSGVLFAVSPVTTLPSLIAWWKFNDGSGSTVADSSGNGYTITLAGAQSWSSTYISFTGATNSYGSTTLFTPPNFSCAVSVWLNFASLMQFAEIFFAGHDDGTGSWGLSLTDSNGGSGNYLCVEIANLTWNSLTTLITPATGIFFNAVVSFDASGYPTLYVNGVQVATGNAKTSSSPVNCFSVGASISSSPERYATVSMKDLRIYNSAITLSQASAIYTTGPSQ